jgi:hypothetical protein
VKGLGRDVVTLDALREPPSEIEDRSERAPGEEVAFEKPAPGTVEVVLAAGATCVL